MLVLVARWVGVVLAVGGTVVTAPDGWNRLWRGSADFLRKLGRRVRRTLARWIPWLRRSATIHATPADASASMTARAAFLTTGLAWDKNAPVGEKVALLRQHVLNLESDIQQVRSHVRKERRERLDAIARLERELRDDLRSVEAILHEHRRRAAEIDKRGLPLIGWGILLTGVPEQHLAALPLLGWLLVVAGVTLGFGAVRRAFLGWRSSRAATAGP